MHCIASQNGPHLQMMNAFVLNGYRNWDVSPESGEIGSHIRHRLFSLSHVHANRIISYAPFIRTNQPVANIRATTATKKSHALARLHKRQFGVNIS